MGYITFAEYIKNRLRWELDSHQKTWVSIIQHNALKRDFGIDAARCSGKSSIFSIAFPLWFCETVARKSVGIVTYNSAMAHRLADKVRELSPAKHTRFRKDEIIFSNESSIHFSGIHQSRRGWHHNVVVCDDFIAGGIDKQIEKVYLYSVAPMAMQGSIFFVYTDPENERMGEPHDWRIVSIRDVMEVKT